MRTNCSAAQRSNRSVEHQKYPTQTVRVSRQGQTTDWYQVPDENHQQCALAGMLATGSDDFINVLLPLLTNNDQQVRLSTYRAGPDLLSILQVLVAIGTV